MLTDEQKLQLEEIIDTNPAADVLDFIAGYFMEKASVARQHHQADRLARHLEDLAGDIDKIILAR